MHSAWTEVGCCAGLQETETSRWRIRAGVCRRGPAAPAVRTVVLLGEGTGRTWHRANHFLGVGGVEVAEVMDTHHAYERLWAMGWTCPHAR